MSSRELVIGLISAAALSGCGQQARQCEPAPPASLYEMSNGSANDTAELALQRASFCIQAKAYEFAGADDLDVARDAVLGACQDQVDHAQAAAYSSAVLSGISTPPPAGFTLQAPPCESGEPECKPWERKWGNDAPSAGTVVGRDGESTSPQHRTGEVLSDRALQELRNLAALRLTEAKLKNCKA